MRKFFRGIPNIIGFIGLLIGSVVPFIGGIVSGLLLTCYLQDENSWADDEAVGAGIALFVVHNFIWIFLAYEMGKK